MPFLIRLLLSTNIQVIGITQTQTQTSQTTPTPDGPLPTEKNPSMTRALTVGEFLTVDLRVFGQQQGEAL